MDDKLVEFPKNKQIYLKRAVDAYQEMNFDDALKYIEQLPVDQLDFYHRFLYASILFQMKKVDKAYDVVKDYEKQFLRKEESAILYVQILLHNRQFFRAQVIIQRFVRKSAQLNSPWTAIDEYCQAMMNFYNESMSHVRYSSEYETLIQKLDNSEHLTIAEQIELVTYLSETEDIHHHGAIRQVLLSLQINPLLQRGLLDTMVDQQSMTNISILWFDQIKDINLKKLTPFADQLLLNNVMQAADDLLLNENPTLNEMLADQLHLQLLLLYPFQERVITDSKFWVLENLSRLSAMIPVQLHELAEFEKKKEEGLTCEEQRMSHWLTRVIDSIDQFFNEKIREKW